MQHVEKDSVDIHLTVWRSSLTLNHVLKVGNIKTSNGIQMKNSDIN